MRVLELLEEIEEIVDTAAGFPLTGKIMIDSEELLEIVREIRAELPDEIQTMIRENKLSMGHARALLPLKYKEDMLQLAEKICEKELSVREVERLVKQILAAEDIVDDVLVEKDNEKLQRRVYMKDLEQKVQKLMGRKVRIKQTGNKKTIELSFEDDGDLEDLIKLLVGEEVFN